MSDNTSVGGPDDGKEQYPPEEDLSDLVEKHDKATNNFYESLVDFADTGSLEEWNFVEDFRAKVEGTWLCVVAMLARDYGVHSDSFTRAITTLWLGDEEERTELLSIIGPEADYEQTHGGDFASLYYGVRGLVQCESVDDKAITVLVSAYMECIDFDIRDFRKAIDARNPFGSTENPDNQ